MKFLVLIVSFLISTSAFSMHYKECIAHVESNMETFSICGPAEYEGHKTFTVESCYDKGDHWLCTVEQDPWPSSDCRMEIVLDEGCYYNISTTIIREGREDM